MNRTFRQLLAIYLMCLIGLSGAYAGTANPLDTWAVANTGSVRNLNGVGFGNGLFVAVGDYGTVLTSPDGTHWTQRVSGISGQLFGVAYGNGTYVAVGAIGGVTASADGIHWQPQTSGATEWLYGVTYAGGRFVAVGSEYAVVTSTDGTNWVRQPVSPPSILNTLNGVAYGNGTYAAVGGGYDSGSPGYGRILSSVDAGAWSTQSAAAAEFLYGVAWGQGTFVAVGGGSQLLTGTVVMALSSTNGSNWVLRSSDPSVFKNILSGVAYGGGTFVAVGQSGSVVSSGDGANWVARTSGFSADLSGVAFGNGIFVAVGASGAALASGPVALPPAFSISPGLITNDYPGQVQLSLTNLAVGQTVRIETFLDIQGTGTLDPADPLYQSFEVTDGLVPRLGGVRNVNIPADADGLTNGQITVNLDLNGDFGMGHVAGTYFYRVSDPAQSFSPVTATFTITPKVYPQGVTGVLTDAVTGKPVPGAVVSLLDLENNVLAASAFTDITGHYTIYSPPGHFLVLALRVGYYAGFSVDDFNQLFSMLVTIRSNQMTAHDTAIAPGDRTISGRLGDSVSGAGIPGIMLYGLSQTATALHFGFNFSDAQGAFAMPVTSGPWAFALPPLALARLGYVGATNLPPIDTSTGSVAAVDLPAPKATALIYGRLLDTQGRPLAGVRVDAFSVTNHYQTAGISDTNGDYSLGVIPGGWGVDLNSAAIASLGYEGQSVSLAVTNNQTLLQNFTFSPIPPPDAGALAWQWLKPLPQGNDLHGVALGQGTFVTIGAKGTILRSVDGASWQTVNSTTSANLDGVAYGNGMFVVVGGDGAFEPVASIVLVSTNGIDWQAVDPGAADSLGSVAFGNNRFVAVSHTSAWASVDGVHWQTSNPGVTNDLRSISFGHGLFVGVGDGGTIVTSTNGVQWTLQSSGTVDSLQTVAATDTQFAAVGITTALTSPDGVAWTSFPFDTNNIFTINAIAAVNGAFLGVGGSGAIVTSTNGAVWTAQPAPAGVNESWLDGIASGNGQIVAVGGGGMILTSSDALSWTSRRSGAVDPLTDIAFGRGVFVAGDSAGRLLSSSDGGVWTPRYSNGAGTFARILYANGRFVAVGYSGPSWSSTPLILCSRDGINWLPTTGLAGFDLKGAAYGGGQFVVVGGGGTVLRSTDAIHWTANSTGLTNDLGAVAYGNGLFVAGETYSGVCWVSADAVHWQGYDSGASRGFNDLAFGNNQFIGVGDSGTAVVSADGTNWVLVTSSLSGTLSRIAFGAGNFVVVGDNAAASADGLHWTRATLNSPALHGVVYANRHFVAVGDNGAVLESGAISDLSPVITLQPDSHTVGQGESVDLSVGVQSNGRAAFQWMRNGLVIGGATNASFFLPNLQAGTAGDYTVRVSNGNGSVVSDPATVLIQAPVPSPLSRWNVLAPAPSTNGLFGIAYGQIASGGMPGLLAVGDHGTILVSEDGRQWTPVISGTHAPLFSVAFAPTNGFVAVGDAGVILASSDGFSWQTANSGTTNALERVAFGAGRFIAVGDQGTLLTSSDGLDWSEQKSGTSDDLLGVAVGAVDAHPVVIAVGTSGTILTSTNMVDWVRQAAASTNELLGVAYADGLFVAVGDGGAILTSPDGVTWQAQASPTTNALWSVTFRNGYFVAVGANGALVVSRDAAHWRVENSGTADTLYEVAFANGSFWAVTDTGGVVWSDPLVVLGATLDTATRLSLDGPRSRFYRLEYTDALAGANDWKWLTEVFLSDPAGDVVDNYSPAAASRRLYRAVLLP